MDEGTADKAAKRMPPGRPLTLSEVPLFAPLSRRHLCRVADLASARRFRDEVVVREGDPGDAFYVILEGTASVEMPGGRVKTLSPGGSFGELALLDGAPRAATVTAVGELLTACIERSDFLRLLDMEPGMDLALIRGLVAMIREMQKGLVPTEPSLAGFWALDTIGAADSSRAASATSPGWSAMINRVRLFRELDDRQLGRVMKLAALRQYEAGEFLARVASPGDAFHIILEGRARVETPEGRERILEPGDSFGELALIDDAPRAATVTAIDEVTTARLGRSAFLKLVRSEPAIAMGVLRGLVRTIRDIELEKPTP